MPRGGFDVATMSGYKYDDEGGQFFTFALTAVLAFVVPYTYRVLVSREKGRSTN